MDFYDEISTLENIARTSIYTGDFNLRAIDMELDFNDAKYNNYDDEYSIISVPIVGDNYALLSNLGIIVDSNGNVVSYVESLFTKGEENKFVITIYQDGIFVKEDITDIGYVDNDTLESSLNSLSNSMQSRSGVKTAVCLAAILGVDLVVAYLIGSDCTISCSTGVLPVCAACVAGVCALGTGNIAGIVKCFDFW